MSPQILSSYDPGYHQSNLKATIERLEAEGAYKDLSTIIICPTLGSLPAKVAAALMNLYTPPNQRVVRMWPVAMEVGEAYSKTLESILANPDLAKYRYVLTVEADNLPPPDGLVKLLAQAERHPEYSCIGGLYFCKGPGGCAHIWGDISDPVLNFRPQKPVPDALVECNGTSMGFNLWRLDMFKDERLRRPWFKTLDGSQGAGIGTQDLYFWGDAKKYGYRCAVDCSIKVGHYDFDGKFGVKDFTW